MFLQLHRQRGAHLRQGVGLGAPGLAADADHPGARVQRAAGSPRRQHEHAARVGRRRVRARVFVSTVQWVCACVTLFV